MRSNAAERRKSCRHKTKIGHNSISSLLIRKIETAVRYQIALIISRLFKPLRLKMCKKLSHLLSREFENHLNKYFIGKIMKATHICCKVSETSHIYNLMKFGRFSLSIFKATML